MSRVGRYPINVPASVEVQWQGADVSVKGPKGALAMRIPDHRITLTRDGEVMHVERDGETKRLKSFHGLVNRLLANMITGVTKGFEKRLEIQGIGYRAAAQGSGITLALGYSHPISYTPPAGVKVAVPEPNAIVVSGIDKQAVGEVAAVIRRFRPPDTYKGKGIRYAGEYVRILEGKKSTK